MTAGVTTEPVGASAVLARVWGLNLLSPAVRLLRILISVLFALAALGLLVVVFPRLDEAGWQGLVALVVGLVALFILYAICSAFPDLCALIVRLEESTRGAAQRGSAPRYPALRVAAAFLRIHALAYVGIAACVVVRQLLPQSWRSSGYELASSGTLTSRLLLLITLAAVMARAGWVAMKGLTGRQDGAIPAPVKVWMGTALAALVLFPWSAVFHAGRDQPDDVSGLRLFMVLSVLGWLVAGIATAVSMTKQRDGREPVEMAGAWLAVGAALIVLALRFKVLFAAPGVLSGWGQELFSAGPIARLLYDVVMPLLGLAQSRLIDLAVGLVFALVLLFGALVCWLESDALRTLVHLERNLRPEPDSPPSTSWHAGLARVAAVVCAAVLALGYVVILVAWSTARYALQALGQGLQLFMPGSPTGWLGLTLVLIVLVFAAYELIRLSFDLAANTEPRSQGESRGFLSLKIVIVQQYISSVVGGIAVAVAVAGLGRALYHSGAISEAASYLFWPAGGAAALIAFLVLSLPAAILWNLLATEAHTREPGARLVTFSRPYPGLSTLVTIGKVLAVVGTLGTLIALLALLNANRFEPLQVLASLILLVVVYVFLNAGPDAVRLLLTLERNLVALGPPLETLDHGEERHPEPTPPPSRREPPPLTPRPERPRTPSVAIPGVSVGLAALRASVSSASSALASREPAARFVAPPSVAADAAARKPVLPIGESKAAPPVLPIGQPRAPAPDLTDRIQARREAVAQAVLPLERPKTPPPVLAIAFARTPAPEPVHEPEPVREPAYEPAARVEPPPPAPRPSPAARPSPAPAASPEPSPSRVLQPPAPQPPAPAQGRVVIMPPRPAAPAPVAIPDVTDRIPTPAPSVLRPAPAPAAPPNPAETSRMPISGVRPVVSDLTDRMPAPDLASLRPASPAPARPAEPPRADVPPPARAAEAAPRAPRRPTVPEEPAPRPVETPRAPAVPIAAGAAAPAATAAAQSGARRVVEAPRYAVPSAGTRTYSQPPTVVFAAPNRWLIGTLVGALALLVSGMVVAGMSLLFSPSSSGTPMADAMKQAGGATTDSAVASSAPVAGAPPGASAGALSSPNGFTVVAFSRDGRSVAAARPADAAVQLWRPGAPAPDRLPLSVASGTRVTALAFDSEGRRLAAASSEGSSGAVRVWDTESLAVLWDHPADRPVAAISFPAEPASRLLAYDGSLVELDAETGQEVGRAPLLSTAPSGTEAGPAALSPDGKGVARAFGSSVTVWPRTAGALPGTLPHDAAVSALAFRPDGRYLATAQGRTVLVWDLQTSRTVRRFEHTAAVDAVAVSADGRRLAAAGGSDAAVWNLETGALIDRRGYPGDALRGGAFSPREELFAIGAATTVHLWRYRH